MEYTQKIETGPIKSIESNGSIRNGYGYFLTEIWGGDLKGLESCTGWDIYPDGTCSYFWEQGICSDFKMGTFDGSKYDDIVRQMENLTDGWEKELNFD